MPESICPYCNYALEKVPQRKTKCPFCNKSIFVKSTPANRNKRLMTESKAKEAEEQWEKYQKKERIIRSLQVIGITKKDLEKEQKSFFKKKTLIEAYISLSTKVANSHKDLHFRKMAHHQIAIELSRLNGNYLPHLKEAAKNELLNYKKSNVQKVEILTAGEGNACIECQKNSGKIFDIEYALNTMPVPCETCSHTCLGKQPGFCRCSYVASFEST